MLQLFFRFDNHPCMWVGNVFGHVCLSVCLSVQVITFEPLVIETSFLVCRYILTISRSSLSIKVIRSRSRSDEKNNSFTYFNLLILCMWQQVINKVKVSHHIKVKVTSRLKYEYLLPFQLYVKFFLILTY